MITTRKDALSLGLDSKQKQIAVKHGVMYRKYTETAKALSIYTVSQHRTIKRVWTLGWIGKVEDWIGFMDEMFLVLLMLSCYVISCFIVSKISSQSE